MTQKNLLSVACIAAIASICLDAAKVSAELAGGTNDNQNDSLRMVVNYGQGKEIRRRSHLGEMEPVSLRPNQTVTITLGFPARCAGQLVIVSALDGGQISLEGPVAVSANGTIAFSFQAGRGAGLYRLMVEGAAQCQLPLYVVRRANN